MSALRIFVWEGHGISEAYHDDGTLVVLAESAEQAREVMRSAVVRRAEERAEFQRQRDAYMDELRASGQNPSTWTTTDRGRAIWALWHADSSFFDGSDEALDREPDRVVEIDAPKWVAFNGGGYD